MISVSFAARKRSDRKRVKSATAAVVVCV